MTIYQEEMQRKAQRYGCITDYDEADQLLLISHKGVHLTAVNPEGFMFYNSKELTDLKGSTANGYTLYCTAKDLYLGTKNLTIGDLADTTIIEPKIFGVICNAMAIRRYGLGAVKFKERTNNQ